ncbi:hypothetical protein ACH0CV_06555 [Brachybacterium paraconglomeratum]|uniref:hypothetical protein n=1 Tax=Brachybacterium paraconglomeratum TaxID=173362 RepID=UPI0038797977
MRHSTAGTTSSTTRWASPDGEADCPVLAPFVADDQVKLWVTVGGSISYEIQIGGSTTVPTYYIDQAELL